MKKKDGRDDKKEEGNRILYTTLEYPCKYVLRENETVFAQRKTTRHTFLNATVDCLKRGKRELWMWNE